MTQPFADALTWVPKSRSLSATLGRAHDLARAKSHATVTLEHMLLALIEDPEASTVLLACNVDLLALNASATAVVDSVPAVTADMPTADPTLVAILEYAVAAARQSKRNEINGAIVLAAIVGEGKSEAAKQLLASGLKFADAVAALRRASQVPRPTDGAAPPPTRSESQTVTPGPAPAGEQAAPAPQSAQVAPEPVPEVSAAPVQAAPPSQINGQYSFDDDPVTTARRRIEAIRNGHAPPLATGAVGRASVPPPVVAASALPSSGPAPVEAAQQQHSAAKSSDWAPPPLLQRSHAQSAKPPRMPPPVPPLADAPVRQNGGAKDHAVPTHAPWSDDTSLSGEARQAGNSMARHTPNGPPIEPAILAELIPERMLARVPTTVEIRIPRGAVLTTAAGPMTGAAKNIILTRALTVKLRAPGGGCQIENAAPETQWFDTRSPQRDADEVRWRWLVTPQATGRIPIQLAVSLRTIAADGMIVETVLPEQQVSVAIGINHRAILRSWGGWVLAAVAGAVIALSLSGSWSTLLKRMF